MWRLMRAGRRQRDRRVAPGLRTWLWKPARQSGPVISRPWLREGLALRGTVVVQSVRLVPCGCGPASRQEAGQRVLGLRGERAQSRRTPPAASVRSLPRPVLGPITASHRACWVAPAPSLSSRGRFPRGPRACLWAPFLQPQGPRWLGRALGRWVSTTGQPGLWSVLQVSEARARPHSAVEVRQPAQ